MLAKQAFIAATPEAIAATVGPWRTESPELGVLLLLPEAEQAALPALQAWFRTHDVPLVGAIFPALIANEGFTNEGALLVGFESMPPLFLLDRLGAGERTAHSRISSATREALTRTDGNDKPTLFLIFDAMVPNIASILDGTYRDLRATVRYAGVNAGSESFQAMPCLFDSNSLIGEGVLGLLLEGQPVIAEHGYPVAKTLMQATSTSGNRIELIDRRPAMEVYQEVIAADFGISLTPENFYDYAVHYPFGVVSALTVLVRIPVAFDADGTIHCVGEVPNHSILRLIRAPKVEASPCVANIAKSLLAGTARDWLLSFYCAGRRMHFGEQSGSELAQLRRDTNVRAVLGALSLGEISTNAEFGIPEFHNAALVCL